MFVDVGDIPTPIVVKPRQAGQFVLQNLGNGTFQAVPLTAAQVAQVSAWPEAPEIALRAYDANFDSHVDMLLDTVEDAIPGALDQAVLAGNGSSAQPVAVASLTVKRVTFLSQTFAWLSDHNYFFDNAPWKITNVTLPSSATWYGAIVGGLGDLFGTNSFIDKCRQGGQYNCGVSSVDPAQCIRNVDVYGAGDVYLGTGTRNVCVSDWHIYRYTPGSVTVEKDYSRFDPDARQVAAVILGTFPSGLDGIEGLDGDQEPLKSVNDAVGAIIKQVMGPESLGDIPEQTNQGELEGACSAVDTYYGGLHIEPHANFPFDTLYSPLDPTFHHYDNGFPQVCSTSENYCIYDVWNSYVLPLFSYPSKYLKPTVTPLDGTTQITVYVTSPWTTAFAWAYFKELGKITQTRLLPSQTPLAPQWTNAIVNQTVAPLLGRSQHWMYPGHVARLAQPTTNGQRVFTHGIGTNQYAYREYDSQTIRLLLGCFNDIFAPDVWRTLDREARKYWKRNWSTPQSLSGEGGDFLAIPQQAQ